MKEELNLMLSHLIERKEAGKFTGLCVAAIRTRLSHETFLYIQSNRPSKELHSQFFYEVYYINNYDKENNSKPAFYWPLVNIDVRIDFIKYLIALQDEKTT